MSDQSFARETLNQAWAECADPEPGDRIYYRVRLESDLLSEGVVLKQLVGGYVVRENRSLKLVSKKQFISRA